MDYSIVFSFFLKYLTSSSSSIFHGVRPLVDPFRSHASRSLFNGLTWFLLPVVKHCFITLGILLRGILLTWCIQFLLYSCSLSQICVIFNSFTICVFVSWMEEMPSQNMPVQKLKVAILPLDLPCSGPVTHSGEILTTGKCQVFDERWISALHIQSVSRL